MRRFTPQGGLGRGFWLVFAASTLTGIANSASAPVLSRYAGDVLDATPAVAGFIVSISALVGIVVQPLAGIGADRFGPRAISWLGGLVGIAGLLLIVVSVDSLAVAGSRFAFGIGYAAIGTAVMAWIVASVVRAERGRALSLFGISIWVGLALGPQLGETVFDAWGYTAVWIVCAAVQLAAVLCVLPISDRAQRVHRTSEHTTGAGGVTGLRAAFFAVARPGVVAALAWSGEGFMLAFLIVHLQKNGLAAVGLTGAASVFTIFAISVIGTRLLLGGLPDRLGPVKTARIALLALALGMILLGYSYSFVAAAAGAVLMGAGFAPLYPALMMLATERLDPRRRAAGVGVFSAFTSVGYASGAFFGGVIAGIWGEGLAFVAIALLQLAAIPVVRHARHPAALDS